MNIHKLLFILCAFLFILVSCNKEDDAILEEIVQIEVNDCTVDSMAEEPIVTFSSNDIDWIPEHPFAIGFEVIEEQITLAYIVNTGYDTEVIEPTSINWTINDLYSSSAPSIQTAFNYDVDYTVTVDLEFKDHTSLSSSFCINRAGTNQVSLCDGFDSKFSSPVSYVEESSFVEESPRGGASFAYIFPYRKNKK